MSIFETVYVAFCRDDEKPPLFVGVFSSKEMANISLNGISEKSEEYNEFRIITGRIDVPTKKAKKKGA